MDTAADGYTLIVCTGIEFEMLQIADPESAKGRRTNPAPVTLIGTQPMVLVARPGLGLRSVDDLVRAARARPGGLSLASAGPGTSLHLAGEMIKKAAGIDLLNVPYKATPQMVTDLAGGNVDLALLAMMITPAQQASASELEAVRTAQLAGFLRALGAGSR